MLDQQPGQTRFDLCPAVVCRIGDGTCGNRAACRIKYRYGNRRDPQTQRIAVVRVSAKRNGVQFIGQRSPVGRATPGTHVRGSASARSSTPPGEKARQALPEEVANSAGRP